jgi:hypothetical protein
MLIDVFRNRRRCIRRSAELTMDHPGVGSFLLRGENCSRALLVGVSKVFWSKCIG